MSAPDEPGDQHSTDELEAEVVFHPRARQQAEAIYAQIQRLCEQLAGFESRHRMTFEEFQASYVPDQDSAAHSEYLEWSRLAEAYRLRLQQWEQALRRASSPLCLPSSSGRKEPKPPDVSSITQTAASLSASSQKQRKRRDVA